MHCSTLLHNAQVNEYTASMLTAGGEWLRAVLRPLKTQSLPRHGVDKVIQCLFLCTQHYELVVELFGNAHSKGVYMLCCVSWGWRSRNFVALINYLHMLATGAGLSVYEIVVQEMAERTLRGEVAELGRHILQKYATAIRSR